METKRVNPLSFFGYYQMATENTWPSQISGLLWGRGLWAHLQNVDTDMGITPMLQWSTHWKLFYQLWYNVFVQVWFQQWEVRSSCRHQGNVCGHMDTHGHHVGNSWYRMGASELYVAYQPYSEACQILDKSLWGGKSLLLYIYSFGVPWNAGIATVFLFLITFAKRRKTKFRFTKKKARFFFSAACGLLHTKWDLTPNISVCSPQITYMVPFNWTPVPISLSHLTQCSGKMVVGVHEHLESTTFATPILSFVPNKSSGFQTTSHALL